MVGAAEEDVDPGGVGVKYAEMVLQHEQQQQQQQQTSHHSQQQQQPLSKEATGDRDSGSDQYGGGGGGGSGSAGLNVVGGSSCSSAPRMHPKKRKYDPSEAEQFATDLSSGGGQTADDRSYSQRPSSNFDAPLSTNESSLGCNSPGGSGGGGESTPSVEASAMGQQPQQEEPQPSHSRRPMPELDLRDWCETRVLAKYKKGESVFVQGVIKSSDAATELLVEFEGPEGGLRQTYDVINSNRFDIIADASPSISDVSVCRLL